MTFPLQAISLDRKANSEADYSYFCLGKSCAVTTSCLLLSTVAMSRPYPCHDAASVSAIVDSPALEAALHRCATGYLRPARLDC